MIYFNTPLGGDTMTMPLTPTRVEEITYLRLSNGIYDFLYVTRNPDMPVVPNPELGWDVDTELFATFEGTASAGNFTIPKAQIQGFLVKRRKIDDFTWTTIGYFDMEGKEEFNIDGIDKTAAILYEYEYALVPIVNNMEGAYVSYFEKCECDSMVLTDINETWVTPITNEYLNITSVVPSQAVNTMYDTYPTIIRNTNANYETVAVEGTFVPLNEDLCLDEESMDDDRRRNLWSKKVMMFLRNGKPKILKGSDSRIWLCYVTNPPTDTAKEQYNDRVLAFEVTEVGDSDKERDLFYAGLIDVPERWWSK